MQTVIKSFRLPEDIKNAIASMAKHTNRTETFYVVEALKEYVENYKDYEIAKARFENHKDEIISEKAMRKLLNV